MTDNHSPLGWEELESQDLNSGPVPPQGAGLRPLLALCQAVPWFREGDMFYTSGPQGKPQMGTALNIRDSSD